MNTGETCGTCKWWSSKRGECNRRCDMKNPCGYCTSYHRKYEEFSVVYDEITECSGGVDNIIENGLEGQQNEGIVHYEY